MKALSWLNRLTTKIKKLPNLFTAFIMLWTRKLVDRCHVQILICKLIFLATITGAYHAQIMLKILLRILAVSFAGMTGYLIWQDLSSPISASISFGKIWYQLHSGSLQVTEAIVSRYIDPCGLITVLDCTPFLWHPMIATVLGWPAGLVGCIITGILWFFGKPKQRGERLKKL